MSFWSDPVGSISDTLGGSKGLDALALGALAVGTMNPELLGLGGTEAITDTVIPSAAAPAADTSAAAYDQVLQAFQNPNALASAGDGVQVASLDPAAGLNSFNAGVNSAAYTPQAANYAIGPTSNGITASGAGAANGLSITPSAASVGANGAASYGLNAAGTTSGGVMGYFNSALDWMSQNKTATAIGGGILASKMGLLNKGTSPGINTTYTGPLTGYKLSPNFKPGGNANPTAINPSSYRNYQNNPYTGSSGGIASMAMGGVPGEMYPQSNISNNIYHAPTQMPTSANQMMGYQPSNTPMAQPIANSMASGGSTSGHYTDALSQELNQYINLATNPDPFNTGYGTAGGSSYGMGQGIVNNDDPDLRGKNPYQRTQIMNAKLAGVTGMQGLPQQNTGALGALNLAPSTPSTPPTSAAQGGIMNAYAGGGVPGGFNLGGYSDGGRLLKGPGDGMSDNIPATIAHKQPARLADGEFVVPADVVSHLGNGSTDAGAKRLYSMMDKVREARTGSKEQGKEIKAEKYLPA